MRIAYSIKVTLALSAGLVILILLGVLGFYSAGEFSAISQQMGRQLQIRDRLEAIRQDIDRAEAAQLRYQLHGASADEVEFGRIALRVAGEIELMRGRFVKQDQKDRVDQLRQAVQLRFELLDDAMAQRGSAEAAALLAGERAVAAAKTVQGLIEAIGERQRQLIGESGAEEAGGVELLLLLTFGGIALAVVMLGWAGMVIYRYERSRQRSAAELASTRERLSLALEGSMSAVWDWDLGRNAIYLSAGWSQMLGAQARETTLAPEALLALVHPDDLERVQTATRGALSGATPDYRVEHRVKRADGTWIWIFSRGRVVLRDSAGRALRITGTNQDVTRRKTVELESQEHQDRLQLALAAAGMVRWDWDVETDAFSWPSSPERLLGREPPGGYLGLQDMVHPADLLGFIGKLDQVAASAEPYKDEYRILRFDGTTAWVSARGYAVRGAGGKVVRVIGVAQDVSEIKQAEQALRASERELRLITDSVPALIGYADADERLQFCNRALAALAGGQVQDIVGKSLRDLLGDEVYAVVQPYARRALAGEKVQFQRRQKRPDGAMVDLDVTYIPRRDALGEVEGFYSLLIDITELKRLDRMKSEFVSTVSHELRTPLTSIRGSLGILAGGVAGPLSDKVRGFIDIAKDNCERLVRLINDILDMEKIESGKMNFQLQVLDLMELVERAVKSNESYAAQHQVRLQVVASLPGAMVQGDGDRLIQVLTNLISNACKFSPPAGSVDISVGAQDDRVRVAVTDHGPGISDEFRPRIFQKFSQADASDLRQKGGTGLGLSICKAIVEGLGGEIGFDSEIGAGATFYFHLPRWREAAAQAATVAVMRSRLLICDGDAQSGKQLQAILDKAGYGADYAADAQEAARLLRERRYVAMMLDIDLPPPGAAALMKKLRAEPPSAGLPVIVFSADGEGGELKEGSAHLGIVDWLSKPIDAERLLLDLRAVEGAAARPRILHVEDDVSVRDVVATIARDIGDVEAAGTLREARGKLAREKFDLVLLDLGLPDGSGWDLLPLVNSLSPPVHVVIFSARDAEQGGEFAPYAFLVKSQTSEQHLIEVIREAVTSGA